MNAKNRLEKLEAILNPRPQRPAVQAIMVGPGQDADTELWKYWEATPMKARARHTVIIRHNLEEVEDEQA